MDLNEIRKRIDNIDDQILSLFLQRMECAEEVAEYKNGELITKGDKLPAWVMELKEYMQRV